MNNLIWLGILLCLSQSASLSGANLAFFSISKMRLEMEVKRENKKAKKVMNLRKDANFLLVTILWSNVSINVLLALLSESILAGVSAFLFSTVVITIVGEILPQAYFTRRALTVAAFLSPLIRVYQIILYPVAKPTAWVLDQWLGKEGIEYFKERDLEELIAMHMEAADTEIQKVEGLGAMNFLAMDEIPLSKEGEHINPDSVIEVLFENGSPIFPDLKSEDGRHFIEKVDASGHKWVVLKDRKDQPRMVMDADHFLRNTLLHSEKDWGVESCHTPIIIQEGKASLGEIMPLFKSRGANREDDIIEEDVVLLWGDERRIITGSDILGRLLRGIVK